MKKLFILLCILIFITSCSCENNNNLIPGDIVLDKDINFYIAIHHEPGGNPQTTDYPEEYWSSLISLVELADQYNQKLSLEMNPQWATYILEDNVRLDLLRSWEANGHGIGLHHHGPHQNHWNGYTYQEEFMISDKYIGSIDEMMDLMKQLPASEEILFACVGDQDFFDYPSEIPYATNGGSEGVEDLISIPTGVEFENANPLQISFALYGNEGNVAVSFEELYEALETADDNEFVGIVFHVYDYQETPVNYNILFEKLNNDGYHAENIIDLFENY